MARKVSVEIVAEAARYQRELRRAGAQTTAFEKQLENARGRVSGFHKTMLGAAAGLVGVGGLAEGLEKSVEAAMDQQSAMTELRKQAENLGFSWKQYGGEINEALRHQRELTGFSREETQAAFGNLLRATHNVSDALKDNSLAADIARAKHMDLQSASLLVVKAQMGMIGLLRRQGIDIKPVTSAMDALTNSHKSFTAEQKRAAKEMDRQATGLKAVTVLHRQFGGVAAEWGKKAEGTQERFRVAIQETEAAIGKALLPTITRYLGRATDWLDKLESSGRLQRDVNKAMKTATEVVRGLTPMVKGAAGAAKGFADAVGGWGNAAKVILSGVLATKMLKVAASIRAIGKASAIASGEQGAAGLLANLTKLSRLGPIAIAVAITEVTRRAVAKERATSVVGHKGAATVVRSGGKLYLRQAGRGAGQRPVTLAEAAEILGVSVESIGGRAADPHDTNLATAQKIVSDHAKARRRAGEKAKQTAADIVRTGKSKGTRPGPADMPDALRLRVAEAAATKTTKDDIRVLNEWLRLLEQRKRAAKSVAAKADIQEEINRTREGLSGFKPKAKTTPILRDALREGIERAKMTSGTGDDLRAYGNALGALRAELVKTKDTARRVAIEEEINKINHAVAGIKASAARAKMAQIRDAFKTAWQGLANVADTAFDRATTRGLDALSKAHETRLGAIQDALGTTLAEIEGRRAALTPAEQALRDRAAAKEADDLAQRIKDAQDARDTAKQQEGESDDDFAKRKQQLQKDLDAALYDQQTSDLEKQAAKERDLRDQIAADQAKAAQKGADARTEAENEAYTKLVQSYQDERDLLKKHFDQLLGIELKYRLQRGELAKKARQDMVDFIHAHPELGITDADLTALLGVTSPAGAGAGTGWGRVPAMAAGGTVTRGGLALVGEHGPELRYLPGGASVVPLGGRQMTVHIEHADMLSPAAVEQLAARVMQRLAYG